MKKLFISQPMRDKTYEEIKSKRNEIIQRVKEKYPDEEIEVIDSFFEKAPHDEKPLWFLSLELLSTADIAYFATDWNAYCGCKIEHICAVEYGIERMYDN